MESQFVNFNSSLPTFNISWNIANRTLPPMRSHAHTNSSKSFNQLILCGLNISKILKVIILDRKQKSPQSGAPPTLAGRKFGNKKAALFAWILLQSIPEETIISPHILEFLEQTLEPIPSKASFSMPTPGLTINNIWKIKQFLEINKKRVIETILGMLKYKLIENVILFERCLGARAVYQTVRTPTETNSGAGEGETEGVSYGQYAYASFPVDVIVHFHTRPSAFRFSCLPASRVECLLHLPSLRMVFSSKRATDDYRGRGLGVIQVRHAAPRRDPGVPARLVPALHHAQAVP
ncbi:unnamed protein product, partial [Leptidea sinapis]